MKRLLSLSALLLIAFSSSVYRITAGDMIKALKMDFADFMVYRQKIGFDRPGVFHKDNCFETHGGTKNDLEFVLDKGRHYPCGGIATKEENFVRYTTDLKAEFETLKKQMGAMGFKRMTYPAGDRRDTYGGEVQKVYKKGNLIFTFRINKIENSVFYETMVQDSNDEEY